MKVSKIFANNSKNISATKIFDCSLVSWILTIYNGVSYLIILLKRVAYTRVHNKNIDFLLRDCTLMAPFQNTPGWYLLKWLNDAASGVPPGWTKYDASFL